MSPGPSLWVLSDSSSMTSLSPLMPTLLLRSLLSCAPVPRICSPNISRKTEITFGGFPSTAVSSSRSPESNDDRASERISPQKQGQHRKLNSHHNNRFTHAPVSDGLSGDVDIVGLLYNVHDMT
ncbi:hypothetical protein J008_06416 [Cryptococcus neoformans]|nr:hypothetical protein J008_06416 [Cryptococcus neoformans var. grubii]